MAFPNENTTSKDNMVVPEVMAAMIQARLPKAIKFSPLAEVDTTLVGVPGDTITVPHFKYIGDAKIFGEGEKIDYSKLTTDKVTTTIKRAGKGARQLVLRTSIDHIEKVVFLYPNLIYGFAK